MEGGGVFKVWTTGSSGVEAQHYFVRGRGVATGTSKLASVFCSPSHERMTSVSASSFSKLGSPISPLTAGVDIDSLCI
jgi:hypothetical protein